MKEKMLYSPNEVKHLMVSGSVVLIDIRDEERYMEGHIPGAVSIPGVFYFLSESTATGLDEFHKEFVDAFSIAGLSSDKTAIVYEDSLDTRYGSSCRGYWILRYLGHERVGVLDGGLKAWVEQGFPLENEVVMPTPTDFLLKPQAELMATKEDVLKAIRDPSIVLLDNRDKPEWLGESSSPYGIDFAPRKGRIPGAKWIEWYEFMDQSTIPAFKSKSAIHELCARQEIYPDDDIIIYCFKGSRASNTFVALKEAGFTQLRNYFASWNEWSRDLSLPIEEGLPS